MRLRYKKQLMYLLLVTFVSVFASCNNENNDDDTIVDDDTGTGDDDDDNSQCTEMEIEGCDQYTTLRRIDVFQRGDEGWVSAWFWDNPNPNTPYLLVDEGNCKFYALEPTPFCDPPCVEPLECGFGDICRPEAIAQDAGEITIVGTDSPNVVPQAAYGEYYQGCNGECFLGGEEITVTSSGSLKIAPFEICAYAPFYSNIQGPFVATQGSQLAINWVPNNKEMEGTKVSFYIYAYHHGTGAFAECVANDSDGEIIIPATIIDSLYQQKVTQDTIWWVLVRRVRNSMVSTDGICTVLSVSTTVNQAIFDISLE